MSSDMLKIAVVGHSLIHPRQYLFWGYVNSLYDIEVLQIHPATWGSQKRKGGYDLDKGYKNVNITNYIFHDKALDTLKEFNPDILYSNTEPWQAQSHRSRRWSHELGCKLAYFHWENIRMWAGHDLIPHADLIVCGNKECEDLVKPYNPNTIILPQVGVMTDRFYPALDNTYKTNDILFVGRNAPEKGTDTLDRLKQEGYHVFHSKRTPYHEMPYTYNSARVTIVPSITTNTWMEQFPYVIAESILCGTTVVAYASGSIRSNYKGMSGIHLVPEGDYRKFSTCTWQIINRGEYKHTRHQLYSSFDMAAKYGHKIVAEKLINAFRRI